MKILRVCRFEGQTNFWESNSNAIPWRIRRHYWGKNSSWWCWGIQAWRLWGRERGVWSKSWDAFARSAISGMENLHGERPDSQAMWAILASWFFPQIQGFRHTQFTLMYSDLCFNGSFQLYGTQVWGTRMEKGSPFGRHLTWPLDSRLWWAQPQIQRVLSCVRP